MQKLTGTLVRDIACDYTLHVAVDWRGFRVIELHNTDADAMTVHGIYPTIQDAIAAANVLLAEEESVSGIEQGRF
jgi:quinol monooxygenase YgiN